VRTTAHCHTLPTCRTLPHYHTLSHTAARNCNTLPLALSQTATLGTLSPTLVPVGPYLGFQSLSAKVSVSVLAPSFFHVKFMGFCGILRNLWGFLGIFGDFISTILYKISSRVDHGKPNIINALKAMRAAHASRQTDAVNKKYYVLVLDDMNKMYVMHV
jgi:hypothetical protein